MPSAPKRKPRPADAITPESGLVGQLKARRKEINEAFDSLFADKEGKALGASISASDKAIADDIKRRRAKRKKEKAGGGKK